MTRRPNPYRGPEPARDGQHRCDTCGGVVNELHRWRHSTCPPPPLPVRYRLARRRLTVVSGERTEPVDRAAGRTAGLHIAAARPATPVTGPQAGTVTADGTAPNVT